MLYKPLWSVIWGYMTKLTSRFLISAKNWFANRGSYFELLSVEKEKNKFYFFQYYCQPLEKHLNNKTYCIVTLFTGIHRTEGLNLLHQFGTNISTRHPKQPGAIITVWTQCSWNDSKQQQFASSWRFYSNVWLSKVTTKGWLQRHKETGYKGKLVSLTRVSCRKHGKEQVQGWQLESQTVLQWEQRPAAAVSWLQWSRFSSTWKVRVCWLLALQSEVSLQNLSLWMSECNFQETVRSKRLVTRASKTNWNCSDQGCEMLVLYCSD